MRRKLGALIRPLAAMLASAAAALVIVAGAGGREEEHGLAPFAALDRLALDALARWRRALGPRPAPVEIAIVGIDETTRAELAEPPELWHRHYGALIGALARADAAALAFGAPLPGRLYDALVPGIDAALLEPIKEARAHLPLVFARTADAAGALRPIHPAYVAAVGADHIGNALLPRDPDGVVRRFEDRDCADDSAHCTFAGAVAATLGRHQHWSGFIPWALGEEFDHLSMREVLEWSMHGNEAKLRTAFAGRVVMLGTLLPAEQRAGVPVEIASREPGSTLAPEILVHAQVLRAMLGAGFVAPAPAWLVAALALLAAPCALGAGRFARGLAVAGYVCLLLGLTAFAYERQVALPVASLALGALAAALIGILAEALAAFLRLYRLQRAFEGTLESQLVRAIDSGETDLGTQASRREVAVLQCRLGAVSEQAAPAPLAEIEFVMDAQLARVEKTVRMHGGEVESFAGDTLLAVFSAPLPIRERPRAALEAAQDILASIARLREELAGVAIEVAPPRIGVASGAALVGVLGLPGRGSRHVLGDIVDAARMLVDHAAKLGAGIVCCESVAAAVGFPGVLREAALPDGTRAYAFDALVAARAGRAPARATAAHAARIDLETRP